MKALEESDKWLLVSLLTIFLELRPLPTDSTVEGLEKLAETARETKTCAKKLRLALDSQFSRALRSVPSLKTALGEFQDLTLRPEALGLLFGELLDRVAGKSGHKNKLTRNEFLVMASELVLLKTNRYNDEHLAELIQALSDEADLSDFSGDAIRKKREHMKRMYPLVYASLVNRVRDFRVCKHPLIPKQKKEGVGLNKGSQSTSSR